MGCRTVLVILEMVVDGDGLGQSGRGDGGRDSEERPDLNLLDGWPTVAFRTLSFVG